MKPIFLLLFVLSINILCWAQVHEIDCAVSLPDNALTSTQRGGRYLTSTGELKVLVVFAKFKDDKCPHQFWPADSYPSEMKDFIDPDMQTGSTHYLNLTNYYNQMSFGNFKVSGKTIGAETPYPIDHYVTHNDTLPNRSQAIKDILEVVDDSIDFREFDNWTYKSDYWQTNEPDSIIDMIVIIWRGLVFAKNWSGEASLGKGIEFSVEDNQKIIKMGFGGYPEFGIYGSGVTVQYWGEKSRERNFKVTIHEIAHWLIHGEHPYSNVDHTFWGMLTLGSEGICANAFERERLGWLNPISIEETILSAPMGDFITSPSSYKYHPSNGFPSEMYYFENHQQLSIYDNGTSNTEDKGIFILHFAHGFYTGDCVRILTADGFWNWDSKKINDCWGNDLPSFKKGFPNKNGFGNRDKITSADSTIGFLYSFIDYKNIVECNDWLHGYGFNNTFNVNFNDVFSPWSNPPAKTWNNQLTDFFMEVINQSGSIVTARFAIKNAIGGKPSKPSIGLDPRDMQQQYNNGRIYLAWGSDFWDGLPIESDINWSELQMNIDTSEWNTVYTGSNRFWSDSSLNYDSTGDSQVQFRVRVRDKQNNWSMWSKIYESRIRNYFTSLGPNADNTNNLTEFNLYQNYPNPFNPSTKIKFTIPPIGTSVTKFVQLKIYDILGNEIATLVDEEKPAGTYELTWDAANLPSGVYFYQLKADEFISVKKMILIR